MKINKILSALGNVDKIAEGIKNNIFKSEEVEQIAKMRWATCKKCDLLDEKGTTCAVGGTQPCCSDCGCSLALKMRSLSSSCPKEKWKAVMPQKLENKLVNQLMEKDRLKHIEKLKKLKQEYKNKNNDSNI
tara:strand:+ start:406 stop:798 length:393 start_codon:yes stop_codon:yes gene_type:complete